MLGQWNVCVAATQHIERLQRACEAWGLPKKWVYRLAPALFWLGLVLPTHWVMWCRVLPTVGAASVLSAAFTACGAMHLVMWVVTARADPGVVRFTPQQSERLVAAGNHRAQLCPHTGVVLVCRAKYVPYINEVVGRFDHYCDWINNAIGARNHGYYLLLMLWQTLTLWIAAALSLQYLQLHLQRQQAAAAKSAATTLAPTVDPIREESSVPGVLLFLFCVVVGLSNCELMYTQYTQVSSNLTSHERFNARRLTYLWRDQRRSFFNPFDRGRRANWLELLQQPFGPDAVTLPPDRGGSTAAREAGSAGVGESIEGTAALLQPVDAERGSADGMAAGDVEAAAVDWCTCQIFSVMDIPNSPLREIALRQLKQQQQAAPYSPQQPQQPQQQAPQYNPQQQQQPPPPPPHYLAHTATGNGERASEGGSYSGYSYAPQAAAVATVMPVAPSMGMPAPGAT